MPGCSARTYIAPPYKHQSSNYEQRMKAARKANKIRVANLAKTLRAIPDDDQVLPEMVVDLTRVPVSEKLEWIENMINEMDSIVNTLHVDDSTKARVQRLKETGEGLFTALRKYRDKTQGVNSRAIPKAADDKEASSKDQPDPNLIRAKLHYADLLDNIAEPFWPQKRTEATKERKSVYGQEANSKERKEKEKPRKEEAGKSGQMPAITENEETKPDDRGEYGEKNGATEAETEAFTPAADESLEQHKEENTNPLNEEPPPEEQQAAQPSHAALTNKAQSLTAHPPATTPSMTHADQSKLPAPKPSRGPSKSAASQEHPTQVSSKVPKPQPAKPAVGHSNSPAPKTPANLQPHPSATDGSKKTKPEKSQKPKAGRDSETTLEAKGMLSAILLAAESANDKPTVAPSQVLQTGSTPHKASSPALRPRGPPQGSALEHVASIVGGSSIADVAVAPLDKNHYEEPHSSRSVIRQEAEGNPAPEREARSDASDVTHHNVMDHKHEPVPAGSTVRRDTEVHPPATKPDKDPREEILPSRSIVRPNTQVDHVAGWMPRPNPSEAVDTSTVMGYWEEPFPSRSPVRQDTEVHPTPTAVENDHHKEIFPSRSTVRQGTEVPRTTAPVPESASSEFAEPHNSTARGEKPLPARSRIRQDTEAQQTTAPSALAAPSEKEKPRNLMVKTASSMRASEKTHDQDVAPEASKTVKPLGVPAKDTSTNVVAPPLPEHDNPSRHFAAEATSLIDSLVSGAPSEIPSRIGLVQYMPPPSQQHMSHTDTAPKLFPSSSPSLRPFAGPTDDANSAVQDHERAGAAPALASYEQNDRHGYVERSQPETGNSVFGEGRLYGPATVPRTESWLPGPHPYPNEAVAVEPAQSIVYNEEGLGPLTLLHHDSAPHSPPLATSVSFNRSAISPSQAGIGHAPSNMMDILLNGFDKPGFTAFDRDRSTPESGISEGYSPGKIYLSGGTISRHQLPQTNSRSATEESTTPAVVNDPLIYRNGRSLAPDGYT